MKYLIVIAGIAAVMLTAIPATTGALYVSTTGSDTANGSFTTPFRTIGHGISVLAGGGTLYVRGGVYNESPYIARPSGTAATPTVISTYQGEIVILQGPGVNTSRVKIIGVHYLNFEGFTITNYNQGLYVNTSDHINVRNVTIHDVGQEAMTIHLGSSYVTVEGCLIHDTGKYPGFNSEGMYIGTGSAGPLDNTNNVTIRGNTIYNTGDEGIELKPGTHDCTVENNTIHHTNSKFLTQPSVGAIEVNEPIVGVQTWGANPNHKIYSNIIHDCTTAISMRTGGEVAFNTISTVNTYGIYVSNPDNDSYVRYIWGNNIAAPTPIFRNGGTVVFGPPGPTPTPTATPTPTSSPTPTPTITPRPTPTPTATPTCPPNTDFNQDGKPDYALYYGGTRQTAVWYMNNNVYVGSAYGPTLPGGWGLAGVADFNRNGRTDYALFNTSTRQTAIWYLSGVTFVSGAFGPTPPSGWTLVAVGKFNTDCKPDYVLYNASTHGTAIWYLNNNVYAGGASGPTLPAGWRLAGVADFNRNGKTDYLLFNPGTRQTAIYYLSGPAYVSSAYGPTIASGYELTGTADFNRDGKPDYVLYNSSTRRTAIWYMNNNVFLGGAFGPTLAAGWNLVAP